jgi:hypothetical protein
MDRSRRPDTLHDAKYDLFCWGQRSCWLYHHSPLNGKAEDADSASWQCNKGYWTVIDHLRIPEYLPWALHGVHERRSPGIIQRGWSEGAVRGANYFNIDDGDGNPAGYNPLKEMDWWICVIISVFSELALSAPIINYCLLNKIYGWGRRMSLEPLLLTKCSARNMPNNENMHHFFCYINSFFTRSRNSFIFLAS